MTSFIRNKFVRVLTVVLIAQGILYYAAARGESAVSPAAALMVIAVRVATPMERRIFRVFILIFFSLLEALHCAAVWLYSSYPGGLETTQKRFLREFSTTGV